MNIDTRVRAMKRGVKIRILDLRTFRDKLEQKETIKYLQQQCKELEAVDKYINDRISVAKMYQGLNS